MKTGSGAEDPALFPSTGSLSPMCYCMLLAAETDKSFLMDNILDYVLKIVGTFWITQFSRMSFIDEECQPLSF